MGVNAASSGAVTPTAHELRMRAPAFTRRAHSTPWMLRGLVLEDHQCVRYRSFLRSANCADSRRMLTNEGDPLKRTSGT